MKRFLLIFVALFSFAMSGTLTYFYQRTDDYSLGYNLWKIGLYYYPVDHIYPALVADRNRDSLIKGKTIEEIKKIFPEAHSESVTESQKYYIRELKERKEEHLWLGESNMIIFLNNGVGNYISIMKG